jgi:Nucleoside-diphosphate-sugar pyrophosphorylase involved in lipopolysaccharide biosynthesis/translation initiation factor 2B, gamma/epsilon subunits (eIF-2Bgamma/eIF-2Bepsilon)
MSQPILQERALILAGGLGTRLRSLLPDRPKVLAPIAGRPFLDILVEQLLARGVRRIVLLLGNLSDQVMAHVEDRRGEWPADLQVDFSVETSPLGTGGAVKLAERFCEGRFLLFNGDTYFDLDIAALLRTHESTRALLTLAAAEVADADRFGRLEVSAEGFIRRFREKEVSAGPGLINAGVYLMEPAVLGRIPAGRAVSLESEVFPALLADGQRFFVSAQHGAFFDIGTPPGYQSFIDFCREQHLLRASKAGTNHDQH